MELGLVRPEELRECLGELARGGRRSARERAGALRNFSSRRRDPEEFLRRAMGDLEFVLKVDASEGDR